MNINDRYYGCRLNEAEQLYGQALDLRARVLGPDHPDTISSVNNLAICTKDMGRCVHSCGVRQARAKLQACIGGRDVARCTYILYHGPGHRCLGKRNICGQWH